ncbi:hypothetical protein ENSA5_01100 [Enhygromyxa salina]|uniref:Uncharacterized protein n=2 Tax=Enhygromyxa salina TaxID=215803 RepID=A0A2S9YL03_9BACT|nr:hypothetical protein ENSA5_01100 [Enhygromyxa salina]
MALGLSGWVVLALVGACDPGANAEAGKAGAEKGEVAKQGAAAKQGAEGEGEGEGEGEASAGATTLDGCLAECESAILSDDNRATCRLQCKTTHGADAGPEQPVVGAYFGCYDSCAAKPPTDRATCHMNCAASVTAGSGEPGMAVCPRACVETLGGCLGPCEDKSGADDQATCRKQCEALANKCVAGCPK